MKWFKHDTDAHIDARLLRLRLNHGMEAFGLYWYCLELIASNVTAKNLTFELEHDSELISFQTGLSRERVESIMREMVELGLFEASAGKVTCMKLMKRMDASQTGDPKFRQALSEIKQNHDLVMTQSADSHDKVSKLSGQKIEDRREDRSNSRKNALEGFDDFWNAYRKKKNKADAEKAWAKLKPEQRTAAIADVTTRSHRDPNWTKDNRQFQPYAASYLRARGWEDEWDSGDNENDDTWGEVM
jgi:polyhydroxyalkanoate synthesis regulator phasin